MRLPSCSNQITSRLSRLSPICSDCWPDRRLTQHLNLHFLFTKTTPTSAGSVTSLTCSLWLLSAHLIYIYKYIYSSKLTGLQNKFNISTEHVFGPTRANKLTNDTPPPAPHCCAEGGLTLPSVLVFSSALLCSLISFASCSFCPAVP